MPFSDQEKQEALFKFIFEGLEGYLCIVTIDKAKSKDKVVVSQFYKWPDRLDDAITFINKHKLQRNVYFCPHLLDNDEVRKKEHAVDPSVLWSDVDDCDPDLLLVEPTILIQSSEDRYQALWKLDEPLDKWDAENLNKRIAYFHLDEGMDKGGWDLTQLLRVPFTLNHKYVPPEEIKVVSSKPKNVYKPMDFASKYPELEDLQTSDEDVEFPSTLPEVSAEEIIKAYQGQLNPRAVRLYEEEPQGEWSKPLWDLECSLIESGIPLDEAFIVCRDSACNKYRRDKRPESELWADLIRAYKYVEAKQAPIPPSEKPSAAISPLGKFSGLLSNEERTVVADGSMIEEFIEWAKGTGDASYQYHQAGAFIVLSTLLAGRVTLPTSFATIRPNLWFMILGDTTLTRKSTAMDLAVDLLTEINPSALLATDGSIEGLLTQLSTRPGRPSLFLRDEFTGLLEMIAKRDYYAGMLEALTKLYDGRYQKRVLKKEEIEIKDPVVNIFAGGIKERTLDLLEERHVTSGFIPRFVFIMGETDLNRRKPVGPPTTEGLIERKLFAKKLRDMYQYFQHHGTEQEEGHYRPPPLWEAELTSDAWRRYNLMEEKMETECLDMENEHLLIPCMSRLAKAGLKTATLIAASRSVGKDKVVVEERDIVHSAYYLEQWREYTIAVIEGAGSGPQERMMMKVYDYINRKGNVNRTEIFQKFKFYGRKGDEVLTTLEDRGLIGKVRQGKRYTYSTLESV